MQQQAHGVTGGVYLAQKGDILCRLIIACFYFSTLTA